MYIIRPLTAFVLTIVSCGCTQNVVNIRGPEAKSLNARVHIQETENGPEIKAQVNFGPGPGKDIKFGPSPGDG